MLPQGRPAPAQDGGGVAAIQGRGTQPHAHAQEVSLATVSRATTKAPRPIKLASSSNECPLLSLGPPFPQSGPHLALLTPSSPTRTPCILPGSQRKLSAAGLGVPRAPWSCGRPDSERPALHRRDGRGGSIAPAQIGAGGGVTPLRGDPRLLRWKYKIGPPLGRATQLISDEPGAP